MEVGKGIKEEGEDPFIFLNCFGSTKMEVFYREKHFTPGKISGKMTLPLYFFHAQKNMPVTPL